MARGPTIETSRLILRRWRKVDLPAFAALNADPEVMEYFPSTLDERETAHLIARFESSFVEHGFGVWAVEVPWAGALVGFCGLSTPTFDEFFTPCVEVGWRFAREHWGNCYATEAATAALDHGFDEIGLQEIVSFTSLVNERSMRVMEKLGMTHHPGDIFYHPDLADNDRLRKHALYRMTSERWSALKQD